MKAIQLITILLLPVLTSGVLHANPELEKTEEKTEWKLFQTAIEAGDTGAVERLISSGFKVDVKEDHWGKSLLHLAAAADGKHPEASAAIVEVLIEAGIDVNSSMVSGLTPLHEAARTGSEEVAKVLIKNGAGVNLLVSIKNCLDPDYKFNNCTPLDTAITAKKFTLAALLQKKGAKTKDELKKQFAPKAG